MDDSLLAVREFNHKNIETGGKRMVKTILGQVKEFKKDSLITPVCMILEVIMEMVIQL